MHALIARPPPVKTRPNQRLLQRKCACGGSPGLSGECEECRRKRPGVLQRRADGPEPEAVPAIVHEVLRSPGQPLDAVTRASFEPRFGHNFGHVRVHADARAATAARAVNARAFTWGRDIVFGPGQYAPAADGGSRLLAHELAHTIQQGAGSAPAGTPRAISSPQDATEIEAEAAEQSAALLPSLTPRGATTIARDMDAGVPGGSGPRDAGLPGGVAGPSPAPAPTPAPRQPTGPPTPTTSSCSPAQRTMLLGHTAAARTWINDIEPKLRDFQRGTASPAVRTVVGGALRDNFHTTAAADVTVLAANVASLKRAINGALDYECVSSFWCDPRDLAYVRGGFAFIRRLGDVNLCPFWFTCGNYFVRVATLLHEVAHQYPGATDNAYEDTSAYAGLSAADAMDNADSYAVFVRQVYHGGSHGPGETC